MANMSYCRFENTYKDLEECAEALANGVELSTPEQKYKEKLLNLVKELARDFTDIEEEIWNERED